MPVKIKCCANCFGDPYLQNRVIPGRTDSIGTCSFCEKTNTALLSPSELKEDFELVTGIYTPSEKGRFLVDWLREDWALFDAKRIDTEQAQLLIAGILDDSEVVRRRFVPSDISQSDTLERWNSVCTELKHQNRFFPKTEFNLDLIEALIPHLQITISESQLPLSWFRARIQNTAECYPAEEMGAPPKDRATHGRANPAGIPYLYLASDASTAVSEIRPHPGEAACVATFKVPKGLSLIDLRQPRVTVSPFSLSSETAVAQMRGDIDFLEQFGKDLMRPVIPQAAAIDYIPSQYLCEFIKGCRYDGVLYRSSVGSGINLALFKPDVAEIGSIESFLVERVTVDIKSTST